MIAWTWISEREANPAASLGGLVAHHAIAGCAPSAGGATLARVRPATAAGRTWRSVSEGAGNAESKVAQPRIVDDRELPPVGRWKIDPAHSDVQFVARHMMISKVRGHFREFEGWLDMAERPEDSSVEVTINAASIDTGDPERDGHLRSPDFLDVERYPVITYRSTAVRPVDGDRYEVVGDLTIRHVTRSVTLDVEFEGVAVDPWGGVRAGFVATGEINRDEFDVTWNQALETGGFLVGKGVRVELDVEAVLQAET